MGTDEAQTLAAVKGEICWHYYLATADHSERSPPEQSQGGFCPPITRSNRKNFFARRMEMHTILLTIPPNSEYPTVHIVEVTERRKKSSSTLFMIARL